MMHKINEAAKAPVPLTPPFKLFNDVIGVISTTVAHRIGCRLSQQDSARLRHRRDLEERGRRARRPGSQTPRHGQKHRK